jgi:hypothetical protein
LFGRAGQSHASILPAGPRIYFSGKAGRGKAAETAQALLNETKALMDFVQTTPGQIVHLTVLMKEISAAAEVEETLREYFGGKCPPLAFLERYAGEGAMEIEALAVGAAADSSRSAQIEHLTPPHLRASPMFSQITRVNRGGSIFTSGAYGDGSENAEAQAAAIFASLKDRIVAGGGSFNHLAKAIYHITGREAAVGMDKLRAQVYQPGRAPAASRNTLRDVGQPGAVMMVDLIGVVREE